MAFGPEDAAALGRDFEDDLMECTQEPIRYGATEDRSEESAEDKARAIITCQQHSLETLDLDTVFGGTVTDLEDEDEESTITTDRDSDDTNITPPNVSMLRSYVPEDISNEIDDWDKILTDEYPQLLEESQRLSAQFLAKANAEWRWMVDASKVFGELNAYKRKDLQPADRSRDWFWENGRPPNTKCSPSVPVDTVEIEPEFHHVNFLGDSVYEKSYTPPEVSLWLAFTSHQYISNPFSRKAVITSQATKWIDPFYYFGPNNLLESSGTELRNAVVGYVSKAYGWQGTWSGDDLDEDEERPMLADWDDENYHPNNDWRGNLQAPHYLGRYDDGDVTINDDGKGSYTFKSTASKHTPSTPSKLRVVENAHNACEEVTPIVSCVQAPEEDGDAKESDPSSRATSEPLSTQSVAVNGLVAEEIKEDDDEDVEDDDEDVEDDDEDVEDEDLEDEDVEDEDVEDEDAEMVGVEEKNEEIEAEDETVSSGSEDVKSSPAEETSFQYSEMLGACAHLRDLAAEKAAAWNDVFDGLAAQQPFLSRKFDFHPTGEEEHSKHSSRIEVKAAPEIPDQIPLVPGFNETFYGPVAIAVGHRAFQLKDWVTSRFQRCR
ncbi:hypothetical protein MMC07_006801 [Pseudocyphellaria aurata]|nr:hypothetical protein [Pseudocyphellaria aurata]